MRKIVFILATFMTISAGAVTAAVPSASLDIKVSPGMVQTQNDSRYYVNFGSVWVGLTAYRSFTLTNTGNMDLVIRDSEVVGSEFSSGGNCPTVLRPGHRCGFDVYFTPWMEGYRSGTLYISTNAGLMTLDLSGWGLRRY